MAQDDHSIMHVTLSTPQTPLSSSTSNEHSDLHRELCGPNYTTVEERQLLESCGDGACIASWLIHPDIDEARVGVETVMKSMHDIDKAIHNLNNVWAHLRHFEIKQYTPVGIIAGFLTLAPDKWLSGCRRLASRSIQHLEFQALRLSGQLKLRLDQLDEKEIRIKSSRYDTSAGQSNTSCMADERPSAAFSAGPPPKKKPNLACQRSGSDCKHSNDKRALP